MSGRDHAVVIGASMGGLLAARVLADSYDRVTVLERDALPAAAAQRRGVPQGRHAHNLLARGRVILEELFPGIGEELRAAGAPWLGGIDDFYLNLQGHELCHERLPGDDPELASLAASRPLLEHTVRSRLRNHGVHVRDRVSVGDPLTRDGRVVGVRVAAADGGAEESVPADLVVDASGRTSRAVSWLEQLGHPRPPVQELKLGLTYVTRLLRLPPDAAPRRATLAAFTRGEPTGALLLAQEGGVWILTLAVIGGIPLGTGREEMLAVVERRFPRDTARAVREAEEIGDPVVYRYPTTRWHRFDRLPRFPEGLLVVGDAICSFDPVYAQGMSVAAQEALALREALQGGDVGLAQRFFRAAAGPVRVGWDIATASDLALPEVPGRPSPRQRLSVTLVDRVLRAAEYDRDAALAFARVIALLDPPSTLMHPRVLRKALRTQRSHRAAARRQATASAVVEPA